MKMFDFPAGFAFRLAEWIETVREMGADKIFMYTYGKDKESARILKHYQTQGILG